MRLSLLVLRGLSHGTPAYKAKNGGPREDGDRRLETLFRSGGGDLHSVFRVRRVARYKKCGDIREEVDAAAKYRHPREEERNV